MTALDKDRRAGGKPVAVIRLTVAPYKEPTVPLSDWDAEGFAWMSKHGLLVFGKRPDVLWAEWRAGAAADLYVVRFELVEVLKEKHG